MRHSLLKKPGNFPGFFCRFLYNIMNRNYVFALDVDGVLTDGKFLWDQNGNKAYKEFGPDDADALKLLSPYIKVLFFSKDGKGFEISKSRVSHMGFEIFYMNTQERLEYLRDTYGLENVIYMGDSFVDAPLLDLCKYGIATNTSSFLAKRVANYVTACGGGERAVAEAVFWIMKHVLELDKVKLLEDCVVSLDEVVF